MVVVLPIALMRRMSRPGLLALHPRLREVVASKLVLDWSPEQISGWLKTQYPDDESMQCPTRRFTSARRPQPRGESAASHLLVRARSSIASWPSSDFSSRALPSHLLENNLRTKPPKYRATSSCLTQIEARRFSNIAFPELSVGPRFES
jgi:hypothetical protein